MGERSEPTERGPIHPSPARGDGIARFNPLRNYSKAISAGKKPNKSGSPGGTAERRRCPLPFFKTLLDAARKADLEVPAEFTPRRLRGSFVTAMRRAKAGYEELETYVGHALGNVTDRHYDTIDLERLRSISALAVSLFVAATEKEGAMQEKIVSAGFGDARLNCRQQV